MSERVQRFDDEVCLVLCLRTKLLSKLNAVGGFLGYPVLCIRYNLICVSNYTDSIVSYALTSLYNANFFLIVRNPFFTHYTAKSWNVIHTSDIFFKTVLVLFFLIKILLPQEFLEDSKNQNGKYCV